MIVSPQKIPIDQEDPLYNQQVDERQLTKVSINSKTIRKSSNSNSTQLHKTKRVRLEGHRGAGQLEPENTFQAFDRAVDLKLDGVELDIWLSKDNVPFVSHGRWPTGQIKTNLFDDELKNIESEVIKRSTLSNGLKIPSFEDLIIRYKNKLSINVEFKGFNLLAAEKVLDIVIKYDALQNIRYSSFHHRFYTHIHDYLKQNGIQIEFSFGFLVDSLESLPYFEVYQPRPGDQMTLQYDLFFKEYNNKIYDKIKEARNLGMKIGIYFPMKVVEKHEFYEFMLQNNIDTIISNNPDKLIEYLKIH